LHLKRCRIIIQMNVVLKDIGLVMCQCCFDIYGTGRDL